MTFSIQSLEFVNVLIILVSALLHPPLVELGAASSAAPFFMGYIHEAHPSDSHLVVICQEQIITAIADPQGSEQDVLSKNRSRRFIMDYIPVIPPSGSLRS